MVTNTEQQRNATTLKFPTLEHPNNSFKDKVVIVTAGNRGGGAVVAETFAASGANVIIIAPKETQPNPRLNEVASKIQQKRGHAKTVEVDVTSEQAIASAINTIGSEYGCIDILINNFSQLHFKSSLETSEADFHRVMQNPFATLFFSKACIPYLSKSNNPHVINISPPIDMSALHQACEHHPLFAISKYSMTFLALGMAREHRGIAFNVLWQERPIVTPTLISNFPKEVVDGSNRPEIYAHAAYLMALKSAQEFTAQSVLDGDILRQAGIDTQQYANNPNAKPVVDIYCNGVDYDIFKRGQVPT